MIKIVNKTKYEKLQKENTKLLAEKLELERLLYSREKLLLENYQYAILVDSNYKITLWNDGRKEERVKKIEFKGKGGSIPTLKIEK